jgi:hypothetical protein
MDDGTSSSPDLGAGDLERLAEQLAALWPQALPSVRWRLALALPSPAAQRVLFQPVRAQLIQRLAAWRAAARPLDADTAARVQATVAALADALEAAEQIVLDPVQTLQENGLS